MASTSPLLKTFTAAAFVAALATPLIGQLSGAGAAGNKIQENRLLNTAPTAPKSYASLLDYPQVFERYYNDHFGFREPLLAAANTLKVQTGVSPHVYTMIGRDGWAYLSDHTTAKTTDRYTQLNDEALLDLKRDKTAIAEILQKRGIQFIHLAVPEKDSIYPEFLPRRFSTTEDGRLKAVNQLFDNDPNFVNALQVILQAKQRQPNRPLYFQLDSHWNCWGAYLGYQGLMRSVTPAGLYSKIVQPDAIVFRDVSPRNQEGYSLKDFLFGSTASRDSAFECEMASDKNIEMHMRHNNENMPNINGVGAKPEAGLSVRNALYTDWQSTNQNIINGPRAIIVRDSFSSYLAPFLVRSFNEILFVHKENILPRRLKRLVEKFEPDILIYQYSERELYAPENNVYSPLLTSLRKPTREKQQKPSKPR